MEEHGDQNENVGDDFHISMKSDGEITHITVAGTATVIGLMSLFSEISRICHRRSTCKILCESRMRGFGSFMDILTLRASLMTFELPAFLKIAMVSSPEYLWVFHTLGNSIYLTAGASADVFGSVEEARAWLLHEPGHGDCDSIMPLPT